MWARKSMRDNKGHHIFLEDHLRQMKGEQPGGGGEPETASTCPSCPCNRALQRGRWDTSGEWELAEAREAHWQALAAAAMLEECIERVGQSTTRMQSDICCCSWVGTGQEGDLRGRVAGRIGPCQRKATNLGCLHWVWMAPIDRSLSQTQEWHQKKNRYLSRPPLILIWGLHQSWGQTSSASCRSQPSCKVRVEEAIFLKDPQQRTTKIGSSRGDVELIHPIGGRS